MRFESLENRALLAGDPLLVGGIAGALAGRLDVDADLKLVFSEPVQAGSSGTIAVHRASGAVVESFAAGSPRLHFDAADSSLSIDPTWVLDGGNTFYVTIDAGAVKSVATQNAFAGVADTATLAFSTGAETTKSFGDSFIRDQFPGTSSDTIGDLRVLYVRATYTDVNRATNTLADAQQDMEQSSVGWIETSKGRMPMTTVYTPTVTLPFSHEWMMTFDQSLNALGLVHQAATTEATKLGYSTGDYDMLVVRFDTSLRDGASYGGGGNAWLAWGGEGVMLHEGGHALGLGHARSVSWDGTVVEYGNYIDWMGGGGGMAAEYGANTQVGLGWIDGSGVLTNPGPGTYRIHAMDYGRTQVGRAYVLNQNVPKDVLSASGATYSLEYRPRLGPTFATSALLQRNSQLIDLVPATWQQEDAGIQVGQTVRIPGSDSYFSVVAVGDGYIDVSYREGTFGDNVAPSASFTASATTVRRFDSVTFTADAVDANADALGYLWTFSDGVIGSGATYTRSFTQSAAASVTVTLTVADRVGGSTTVTGTVAVGAGSTGTPATFGSVTPPGATTLPTVSVAATDAFASEGGDSGTFTFRRVGTSTSQSLTLQLAWAGPATVPGDFASLPTTVTIPAGASFVDLTVTPVDDTTIEATKTLTVSIQANSAYTVSGQATSATMTVGDDDTPVLTIQAIDGSASEPTAAGRDNGAFLISRTGPSDAALTVYYGLSGTAFNGSDFGRLDGQVVIPAGMSSVVVPVVPVDDAEGEADETVNIRLASFNSAYSVGPASNATVTIRDNGDLPTVTVRATTSSATEGANAVFTLTVVGGSAGFTVTYTVGGTATGGVDYQTLSGSVVIPAGTGLRTVQVPVQTIADGVNENDESVTFRIDVSAAYSPGIDTSAQATIQDAIDQSTGGDRIRVSRDFSGSAALSVYDASESGTPASFFVYGDNNTVGRGAVTVTFALGGTATPGVDYTGRILDVNRNQIATFTPAATNTVTIPADVVLLADGTGPDSDRKRGVVVVLDPVADGTFEGTETVSFSLASATGSKSFYPIGINGAVTVNLIDADTSSTRVGFEGASTLVGEGNTRELAVTLNQAAVVPVTVHYRASGGSALGLGADWAFLDVANGNAQVTDGWLTFSPGETRKTITVKLLQDRITEDSERFGVTLEAPRGASLESSARTHAVTVYDVVPDGLVKEERWAGTAVFTNGTWDSVLPETVGYLNGLTTAQNVGNNYSRRLTGTITAPATGSYTFYASGDDDVKLFLGTSESASSKSLIASVPSGGYTSFQQWNKYGSQQSVAISLVAGQKYYVEVQHKEGSGGDHVSIGWTGPGISPITPITTAVTPPDNGNRYVGFVTDATTLTEGQSGRILLTLDRPNPTGTISVDVQRVAGATATSASDYTLGTTTVVFAPGETTKAIDVAALSDATGEALETVTLRLANASGAAIAGPVDHLLSIVDALAPSIAPSTGYVASGAVAGTLVTQSVVTPAANGSVSALAIISGNPRVAGSATAAFAIDNTGRITVANPAAIPSGSYEIRLSLRATDAGGASALGYATVVVNGSAIREERWSLTTAYDTNDWSATPAVTNVLSSFATPQDVADYYSRRITGVFTPATSGNYSFWIAARDTGRLTIAPFDNPTNETTIAASGDVAYQSWDTSDAQQSAPQSLVAGTRYILRAYQKENYWGDHLSVAWSGPGFSRQVIPAAALHGGFADTVLPAPVPSESTPAAVATYTMSTTALTDTGASASITAGQFTRDQTLGLSGTGVAGGTATVYEGAVAIGTVAVAANGSWSLTTPTLSEGDHTFRAEVVDGYGNVAITASVTFTVRSRIEIGDTQLISHAVGTSTGTATGPAVGSVAGFTNVNQGVIVYTVPTDAPFEEQRWSSGTVYDNGTWDSIAAASASSLTVLSAPQNVGDNYSRRIRGTITAPQTGTYTFSIASDDNSRLYLSNDSTAANKVLIASVSGWTGFQEWGKYASQKSVGVSLQAGTRYYIEVQHQEGGGGDHVSVGWTGPGIGSITPIAITSNLVVADVATGQVQLVNRSLADPAVAGSSAVSYAGTSPDGGHVFFSSNAVTSFGSGGTAFTDTSVLASSPASDLFGFDRATGTIRLLTSGATATTSNSRQSQFVGATADGRYAVLTTDYAENIGGFTTPGKPAATTWTLVDGGYPNSSGKLKTTTLGVADIDPTKITFALSGGYITNQGLTATASSPTIERGTGTLTFWVQGLDNGTTTKAVKLELSDVAGGILVKATAAKYVGGNQPNYDWRTNGSTGTVATSGGAGGYGVSTLEARGADLNAKMLTEGAAASTDVIAVDLVTGAQRLLSHSAAVGSLESQAANVTNVRIAGSGGTVLFTAADAARLGNGGTAFTDAAPAVSDLFAADLATGQIRLLSHGAASATASAGVAVALQGVTDDGSWAVFSANDATAFGFTDSSPGTSDLFAVSVADGTIRLLSRASAASATTTSGQAVTFEKVSGSHVYFSATDATKLGFTSDLDSAKADLFRFNLATGAVELISHVTTSATQALGAAYYAGSLTVSPDGRYVAFAVNLQASGGGFTAGVTGSALLLADTSTNAIRMLNSGNAEGTSLSYGAWGSIQNKSRFFTPDSTKLVWQTDYIGWVSSDVSGYSSGLNGYSNATLLTDLSTGLVPAGTASVPKVVSHSAAGVTQLAPAVTLLGVSADSRLAFFSAADATRFGNSGAAFTDADTAATDIFAVDLASRGIDLVSGQAGASYGQAAAFVGASQGGSVITSVANLAGVGTLQGPLTDTNGGSDLIARRFNLIDLPTQYDTGTTGDDETELTSFPLDSAVTPGIAVQLLDNGTVIDSRTAAQTTSTGGLIRWQVVNAGTGSHLYSVSFTDEQVPIRQANPLGASTLTVKVTATTVPTIATVGPALAAVSATYGSTSGVTSTAIAGSYLTGVVTATAPTGFQVSSDGSTWGASATFAPSAGSVSGTLRVRLAAGNDVGSYSGNVSLSGGGATAINVAVPSSSVIQKAVTVVAVAKTKTYGTSDPVLTAVVTGLLGSDAVSGSLSRVAGEDAGTYAITQGTLAVGSNYSIAYTAANLTIAKKVLTVQAGDASRPYGTSNPSNTATISGFVNGETAAATVTGTPAFTVSATPGSAVGTYAITPTAGSLTAKNYAFTDLRAGTLTVTKAAVTVRADNLQKVSGDADPAFTYSAAGFYVTATNPLTSQLSGSLVRDSGAAVGSYAIRQGSLGLTGAAAGNYDLTFTNGTLSIVAAPRLFVTGAFARGSAWTGDYLGLSVFTTTNVGTKLGYALAAGSTQLDNASALTWVNVNTISMRFSEPVNLPAATALKVVGVTNSGTAGGLGTQSEVVPSAVSLLDGGTVVQWTLPQVLASGKWQLILADGGVTSASGNRSLDGDWTNSSSTFSAGSGNGTAGGEFRYRFNILAGDVNPSSGATATAVDTTDIATVKSAQGQANSYSNFRSNLNGDGAINATDVALVTAEKGKTTLANLGGFFTLLVPASAPTVDATFAVTFAEDAVWRAAISAIKVNGTALPASAYAIGSGSITFDPSKSSLLQTAGTKKITLSATGYADNAVSQPITAGAAAGLVLSIQPRGPTANGGLFATGPIVRVVDKYGNIVNTSATITASVESGTGSWSLSGTTSVAAVAGTAGFQNLRATNLGGTAITGARIRFSVTIGGLSFTLLSNAFTIPS